MSKSRFFGLSCTSLLKFACVTPFIVLNSIHLFPKRTATQNFCIFTAQPEILDRQNSPKSLDPNLLISVAGGDEKAFRKLFDHYWDRLFGVALAFTKSPAFSEELIQDVFLKIWQSRENLGSISNLDGYIFTIARNHIYNGLRRKIREIPFEDELKNHFSDSNLADDLLLMKDAESLVHQAVDTLSPQQKAVFKMSRFEGLTHEEIAQRLNISHLTVKVHMSKALQNVRNYIIEASGGITSGIALFFFLP